MIFAQTYGDHVVPLKCNPVLVKLTKEAKRTHTPSWRLISDSIMAKLPFLDDFSHGGPYPNDSLWMDNAAFINNTFPICPHTIGVATLDGVNGEGQPYNPSCPPGSSLSADSLTSRPIDLTKYVLPDSLWLSFYWQAGGKGYPPKAADTLLLQFRTSSTPWTTIWYQTGYTPSPTDTNFHLVMVPIKNAIWLDHNFQFRFKNYACTSGNVDQWNLDEVYMNAFRQWYDTVQSDVSFVYESTSLLANYEYMPWEQFTSSNDLRDSMFMYERNNYIAPINASYTCTISTPTQSNYNGGSANILPFFTNGYNNVLSQTHIPIKSIYNFSSLSGPTDITMTNVLSPGDYITSNNTLTFDQKFSDFYAYDDGTAEAAYFINGPTPLDLAYQFTLNKTDTLRGLELYFNYLFVNQSNYSFRLALWDNKGTGGSPGNLLFEDDTIYSPKFSDSLNGFVFYPYHFVHPDTPLSGTFYVGWVQTYGDSLNIGWDYNTNSESKIYYNISGTWYPGNYAGSMMMRPIFGNKNAHGPILSTTNVKDTYETLSIYPNPAKDEVRLSQAMPSNTTLRIYSADGREYLKNTGFYGNSINTSTLSAGFYIVEITTSEGKSFYQKLLIQR